MRVFLVCASVALLYCGTVYAANGGAGQTSTMSPFFLFVLAAVGSLILGNLIIYFGRAKSPRYVHAFVTFTLGMITTVAGVMATISASLVSSTATISCALATLTAFIAAGIGAALLIASSESKEWTYIVTNVVFYTTLGTASVVMSQ